MPQIEAIPTPLPVETSIPELIDRLYEIREDLSVLSAQEKRLKEERQRIEEVLWQYHEDNPEVSQIEGSRAKIRWSTEMHFNIEAGKKDDVREWLIQNDHPYLMTWHLNRASTESFMQLHGELPPNVSTFEKRKVSCTKV